jgi:hypothetical protein
MATLGAMHRSRQSANCFDYRSETLEEREAGFHTECVSFARGLRVPTPNFTQRATTADVKLRPLCSRPHTGTLKPIEAVLRRAVSDSVIPLPALGRVGYVGRVGRESRVGRVGRTVSDGSDSLVCGEPSVVRGGIFPVRLPSAHPAVREHNVHAVQRQRIEQVSQIPLCLYGIMALWHNGIMA